MGSKHVRKLLIPNKLIIKFPQDPTRVNFPPETS